MSNSIVKHYDGRNYEWNGSVWASQDDQTLPPSSVSANLDKLLTVEDWAKLGKVPPWGTDGDHATWHRESAKTYRRSRRTFARIVRRLASRIENTASSAERSWRATRAVRIANELDNPK
jgi:hypothetical protein